MTQPLSHSTDAVDTRESLHSRLEAARAASLGEPADFVWVCVEAPVVSPEALLQRFPERDVVLWSPPEGPRFAGIGIAASLTGKGSRRFSELRRRAAELWSRLRAPSLPRAALESPRLFGGFAFGASGRPPEQQPDPEWSEFGPARLVLPRVTYAAERDRAVLALAVERSELERGSASEHVQLLERVYEVVLQHPQLQPAAEAVLVRRDEPQAAEFCGRVDELVRAIAGGSLQKVMTAREVRLLFAAEVDAVATVSALAEQAPECQRFLFRWGDAAFVGATPERLLRRRGRALETEALAGTIDVDAESPERQLKASLKELEEHQLTVSAIQRSLDPVCEELRLPSRPAVHRLKHLLHLRTPIQATLRAETHVLELVERLHPTPAVGGVPTTAAMDWIASREPFDRGWYASPVGWLDALGDGEFNVALRSGLVCGRSVRLYAGAGIVRGSRSSAEYDETKLKLAPMLSSLRARP